MQFIDLAIQNHKIPIEEDDYIRDYWETRSRWVVKLNNGMHVYQDDDRPNVEPQSTWQRLFYFCAETKLYITDFQIGFRTHLKFLPPHKEGYFFRQSIMGQFGNSNNIFFFLIGYLEDNIVYIEKYRTPELIKYKTEQRDIKNCLDGFSLIRKL